METLWSVWSSRTPLKLAGSGYTLKGWSIAALRTNFYIPELGVMLDAGLSGGFTADHIFITHQHCDHCCNIPYHLMTNKEQLMQVYAPAEGCAPINEYIDSAYMMTLNLKDRSQLKLREELYEMIPVTAPSVLHLELKKRKFDIEIIPCYHSVPCVGYGLIEKRIKLKEEYAGLPGKELGALKKQGVEINYESECAIFCYLGDTSCKVLEEPSLEKYKTIMIECTFILEEDLQQAEDTQHMHLNQLQPYVLSHPENTFVLYHFSQRYKAAEILAFFDKLAIENVVPWISS